MSFSNDEKPRLIAVHAQPYESIAECAKHEYTHMTVFQGKQAIAVQNCIIQVQ